ncbi:MAG: cell surface protein, partial [Candidatus Omnitrophica bacterium]|nr:cell surface protein [Candidatus Omnitrophota bacterium]
MESTPKETTTMESVKDTVKDTLNSPMKYLDLAMGRLRELGLVSDTPQEEAPIIALLDQITDLDEGKVVAIARTLNQASFFNEVVREQIGAMELGERYEKITNSFNSIRDDAKSMVEQLEDGELSTWERMQNVWMKVTRGDIPERFEDIKKTYLEVA